MPRKRGATDDLDRARELYDRRSWQDAFHALTDIDREQPLGLDDLERLSWSAALSGRDDDLLRLFERLYHGHVGGGSPLKAARIAVWCGMRLAAMGEMGHATGLARARRTSGRRDRRRQC